MMKTFSTHALFAIALAAQLTSVSSASADIPEARHDALESSAKKVLQRLRTSTGKSSFCYVQEGEEVRGVNEDEPVRIASTMKLLTTMWALDVYGPNHRYVTKVYYQKSNGEMHIEGSKDPFFHRSRFYLLLSDLKAAGITSVNRLTFDSRFYLNMEVTDREHWWRGDHYRDSVDRESERKELEAAFQVKNWWNSRKKAYSTLRREQDGNPELQPALDFSASSVDMNDQNPLAGKPGVTVFEIRSLPLKNYLKFLNNWSINPLADELFLSLGGLDGFKRWLKKNYQIDGWADHVYTGSGFPLRDPRRDTTMTCSQMVRLIRRMDMNLGQKYKMDLADVMMVSGLDDGTYENKSHALVVKTGTVDNTKNLAGSAHTSNGEVYFGIFLQAPGSNTGTYAPIITSMMSSFGGAKPVQRTKFVWDPLDNQMSMKAAAAPAPKVAAPAPKPAAPAAVPVRRN